MGSGRGLEGYRVERCDALIVMTIIMNDDDHDDRCDDNVDDGTMLIKNFNYIKSI